MKRLLSLGLIVLALAGCADMKTRVGLAAPAPVAAPLPPPPDPKTQMTALESRIAILVARERLKIDPKAQPLTIDTELSNIARERAQDMATKNYLAHAAPNGQTSATLLMDRDEDYQGLLGENLAAQYYRTESGVDADVFAQRFMDTWMGSPAHRDNLAFVDYALTGVGAAVNGDTVYVALLFSTQPKRAAAASGEHAVASFDTPVAAKEQSPPAAAPLRLRGKISAQ